MSCKHTDIAILSSLPRPCQTTCTWCLAGRAPIGHFWLHHTVHCTKHLHAGSASAERMGQGEVCGVIRRVTCTWWLVGLALKGRAMVGTRWVTSHPEWMDRLTKHYSHLVEGWFLARKAAWGCRTTNADYFMLVNEWAWSKSQVCSGVVMGSVLESELGNGDTVR